MKRIRISKNKQFNKNDSLANSSNTTSRSHSILSLNSSKLKRIHKYKVLHKIRFKKHLTLVTLSLFSVCLLVTIFGVIYLFSYLQLRNTMIPTPEKVFPDVALATEIFDRNGVRLYRLYNDESNNVKVDIGDISDTIKASFMAAEDSDFYIHKGINPSAILRCTINSLSKERECGASTITQQLIKITTKQSQQTLERKIDEMLLSLKVESNYNKNQILEMYLRVTPYGSNITGIKTAAKFYFGIDDLKKLDLAQSIVLASLVNNPTKLSPTLSTNQPQALLDLKNRENYILNQLSLKLSLINSQLKHNNNNDTMQDIITTKMIEDARREEVVFIKPEQNQIKAGHFVNYVLEELQKRNYKNNTEPFSLSDLQTGGYKIYTTLDYNLQQVAEKYTANAGNDYKKWNMHNAAVITIKPSTGEIITMAGSRSFDGKSENCNSQGENCQFNPQVNVLTSLQSPGSTNKPFGYYLAFKESKLFPGSLLPDIPINLDNYTPKDWDGEYLGVNNSAREMLRQSRNIPALEVVKMIGVENYLNNAKDFGYTTYNDHSQFGPSVILGGADVLPIEHIQAYGVFANGGDLVKVDPILKISDKYNKSLYDAHPQRKNVADPKAVYLVNQSLYRLDSLGGSLAWDDREMSGKTGTTENNKDSLVVMYSPDFVTLGWGGNNNNDPLNPYYGWPAFVVIPWVRDYMNEIGNTSYFNAKSHFSRPDGVYYGGGDCDPSSGLCRGITSGWLISGREPSRGDVSIKRKNDGSFYYSYLMPVPELQGFLNNYQGNNAYYKFKR